MEAKTKLSDVCLDSKHKHIFYIITCMNHEQSVYQGTIGDFSRITSAYFRGPKYTVPPPDLKPYRGSGPPRLARPPRPCQDFAEKRAAAAAATRR